jgi:hypothetical protein
MTKLALLILIIFLTNGCSLKVKYIDAKTALFKKNLDIAPKLRLSWPTRHEYDKFRQETKDKKFNGYSITLTTPDNYLNQREVRISKEFYNLKKAESWARLQGFISYSNYTDAYTFMMFTLNQEPLNKNMLPYFNTINRSYEAKLTPKTINQFVEYPCDKHIVFTKYERDDNFRPLKATCYAKRLDKDVFLVTRFAHPNTQEDKKLFQTQIIPTMLKSIQATPTKLSPWEYY